MKNALKFIWGILCYPLWYILFQVVVSVLFTLWAIIALVVEKTAAGEPLTDILELTETTLNVVLDKTLWIMLVSAVIVFGIMFLKLRKRWKTDDFFSAKTLNIRNVLLSCSFGVAASFTISGLLTAIDIYSLVPEYEQLMEVTTGGDNVLLNAAAVGLLGPFLEEVIFRGVIFSRVREKSGKTWVAVAVSSLLFGLIHMNLVQGVYAALLGVFLALIFVLTKSLWAAIITHMAVNLTSVIIGALQSGEVAFVTSEADASFFAPIIMALVCGIIASLAFWFLYKKRV
ncbi:hypothetical protein FACS189490_09170 [Clostridia bacterium]|nr:hypothetical protein FACS189490_09170 [Clostridia bacterium]